jgi:hypothetical protein
MAFWKWYKYKTFCSISYKEGIKFLPSRANKKYLARVAKSEEGLLNY